MIKLFVFFLLIITTAGTIVPCCGSDDCCEVNMQSSDHEDKQSGEGTCSPFFACATCAGFVEVSRGIQINKLVSVKKEVFHELPGVKNLPTYSASCWQPPRNC